MCSYGGLETERQPVSNEVREYIRGGLMGRGLGVSQVRVQCEEGGKLVIAGEPEQPENPWGVTAFKKVGPTLSCPHTVRTRVYTSDCDDVAGCVFGTLGSGHPSAQQHQRSPDFRSGHSPRPVVCPSTNRKPQEWGGKHGGGGTHDS